MYLIYIDQVTWLFVYKICQHTSPLKGGCTLHDMASLILDVIKVTMHDMVSLILDAELDELFYS
jgi:hypothetical protein